MTRATRAAVVLATETPASSRTAGKPCTACIGVHRSPLQSQQELVSLLCALAATANEAGTPQDAMQSSLRLICEHTGWTLGRLIIFAGPASERRPVVSLWHVAESGPYDAFMRASNNVRYDHADGQFLTTILRDRKPVWLENLAQERNFRRKAVALEAGLQCAFAFPVIVGNDVTALLEFYATEPRPVDGALVDAVTSVAAQLARLVERQKSLSVNAHLAAIVESSEDAIISRSLEGTITSWNGGAERMFGYSALEAIGRPVTFFHPATRPWRINQHNEHMLRGEVIPPHESQRRTKDARLIDVLVSVSPVRNASGGVAGASVIIHDITALKKVEQRLSRASRAHRVLAECSHALVRAKDERNLLQEMCRILIETGGYVQTYVGYPEHDAKKTIRPVAQAGFEAGYLEAKPLSWSAGATSMTGRAILTGERYITRNILTDPKCAHLAERARLRGFQSLLSLPLNVDGSRIGGFSLYAREADAFDDEEMALIATLTEDIAFGIGSLRREGARREAEASLKRLVRARRVMAECSRVLVHATNEQDMLSSMCRVVVESGGYKQGWIGLKTGDAMRPLQAVAYAGYGADAPMTTNVNWSSNGRYLGLAGEALDSGEIRISRDILNEPAHLRKRVRALQLGYQASIAIPLKSADAVTGVLVLHAAEAEAFDEDELVLLGELADDIAFGVASLRVHARHKDAEARRLTGERQLRETFEQAAVGMMRVDLAGAVVDANQKLCDLLGYAKHDLVGMYVRDITHPDDNAAGARFRAQIRQGSIQSAVGEKRYLRKDGSAMWARRTMSVACDDLGAPTQVISIIEDITQGKELERRFELTFNHAAVGMALIALDGRCVQVNHALTQMLGYASEELMSKSLMDVAHPDGTAQLEATLRRLLCGETESVAGESLYVCKDGKVISARLVLSVTRDAAGDPLYFVGVMDDVTERKDLERRYRETFDQAAFGIAHTSMDGNYIRVNRRHCEMLGYSEAELIGKSSRMFTHPDDVAARRTAALLLEGKVPVHTSDKRYIHKDGRVVWARRTASMAYDALGKPMYVIRMIEDITETKEAAERYRATFDSAPVGIMHSAVDSERLLQVNPKLCEMLGYSEQELLGHTISDIIHPDYRRNDRANYRQQMLDGEISAYSSERLFLRKDGSSLWANRTISLVRGASGEPQYFIRMVEDISQRKQALETIASERALLRAVVDAVPERIYVKDREGRFLLQNAANVKAHDVGSHEELLGKTVFDIFPLEIAQRIAEEDRSIMESGIPVVDRERLLQDAAGRVRWIASSKVPLPDAAGNIVAIVGVNRDITERKRMEQELMVSEETLRATFRQASVGMTVTSLDMKYLEVNDQYCEIVGYTREELLGDIKVTAMSLPDAVEEVVTARRQLIAGEIQAYSREKRLRRKDATTIWVASAISLVRDADGKPKHFVSVVQDISGNKLAEEQLVHLAHYDHLTGLPNRVLFYDRLKQALAQARRNAWASAVLFIDLDRFKSVNDTLGHAHGDTLLKKIAQRLTPCVRAGDTVGRLGGDEFAVILNELASPEDAGLVAQNILTALAVPFDVAGNEIYATASVGIAIYPSDSDNVDTLIRDADAAMYTAKAAGRNVYRYYTAEMNQRAQEKMQLEGKLRHALERDEFLLHFQPKVDIGTGELSGFEALLRWQPPDSALVPPDRFIPLLEETGLIVPVGEWVLRAACAQIGRWREARLKPVPISVNLSARQFQQQDLCAVVRTSLHDHGVAARFIELEITESAAMQNPENSIATLRQLKDLGVHLSIDDFGTGHSSLSYLKRLPIDTVKIDRSFVTDLATNPDDASIAQAIINMAHTLSLKVVAEGVETASQLSFLSLHGCDQMQGYYFSKPLPEAAATEFLRENRQLQRPEGDADNGGRTLLLLDDEENVLSSLKRLLRRDNYRIFTASTAQAAFEILANNKVGVIVSDQRMPGVTGVEFLRRVKELYPDSVRMVLSGYTDVDSVTEAINQGAIYRFLTKPWDDSLLRAHIAEAFRRYASLQKTELAQREAAARLEELSRANRTLQTLLDERGGAPCSTAAARVMSVSNARIP